MHRTMNSPLAIPWVSKSLWRSVSPSLIRCRFASKTTTALKHHDLESFFKFLQNEKVATESTYYKGLLYEYTVQHALHKLVGIQPLTRCGGTGDNGIDLMGAWDIEKTKNKDPLTILVQCKASMAKTGARLFREMEGVHSYHVSKSEEEGRTLLVVAAPSAITKQGFAQFQTTDVPILYCQIDRVKPIYDTKLGCYRMDVFESHSVVQSLIANQAAQMLLKDYKMTTAKINVMIKDNSTSSASAPRNVVQKLTIA